MIKIRRVERLEDIGKESWSESLKLTKESYIFQTYEFVYTWWTYFAQSKTNKRLLLLLVEENGCIVAIAPLMIARYVFMNNPVIQFIGSDICDYMDFIVDYRDYNKYFLTIIEYLSNNLNFFEIDLKYVPEDSRSLHAFADLNKDYGKIYKADACPYIQINNESHTVREDLIYKLKGDIDKNEQKLRKKGDLLFKSCNAALPSKETLEDFFALHIKRWKYHRNKYSQFQYARWRDFIRVLSIVLGEKGWLDFSYLELNKKMVACHFGFRYNKKLYYYIPTFDPEFAVYSPSKILIMKMIDESAKEKIEEFDFLRGLEPYKMAWTRLCRPIYNLRLYSKSKFSKYLGFIYGAARDSYTRDIKPKLKKIRPLMDLWYKSKGDVA